MEDQTQSGSSSATYPRWVMLQEYLEVIKVADDSSCTLINDDDTKTLVAARTIAGRPIQVSLRLADPPALSRVLLRIPDSLREEKSKVLVAHGDSVLIQLRNKQTNQASYTVEHFVYNGGAAADPPRPPSLWLLPPYYERTYISASDDLVPRELVDERTGLLRRGDDDDDFVVAELTTPGHDTPAVASLYMFRSGEKRWRRYHCKFREAWDLRNLWWSTVVPVDDRRLCWVDFCNGVMLVDVVLDPPSVQYVRLPMDPRDTDTRRLTRNVCVTAGGGAIKFVNIFSRCCCGAAASCDCQHSRHAYTIHTWTMRISNADDMKWVKDGMVDATELWALDSYKGLPCGPLDRPIVSLDEPDVICFRLRDTKSGSRTRWQIMVNMRSKTIHSVSRYDEVGYCYTRDKLIPSKVSYFFNTYPGSGRSDPAALTGQSQIEIKRSPSAVVHERQPEHVQASKIFEVLQEISSYGLGPDEVKAYRILSNNNGRRLRSLLRLPKNLRKNWLLIEIKASED